METKLPSQTIGKQRKTQANTLLLHSGTDKDSPMCKQDYLRQFGITPFSLMRLKRFTLNFSTM